MNITGDLEQDSDLLLMLYRDEYYKSDEDREIPARMWS